MTFDVIALICVLGQDPRECQPPTAFEVLPLGNVTNELRCMSEGQQYLAQAAEHIPDGYYAKLVCARHEDVKL